MPGLGLCSEGTEVPGARHLYFPEAVLPYAARLEPPLSVTGRVTDHAIEIRPRRDHRVSADDSLPAPQWYRPFGRWS